MEDRFLLFLSLFLELAARRWTRRCGAIVVAGVEQIVSPGRARQSLETASLLTEFQTGDRSTRLGVALPVAAARALCFPDMPSGPVKNPGTAEENELWRRWSVTAGDLFGPGVQLLALYFQEGRCPISK